MTNNCSVQTMHAGMGTADPADVALMAYDFLMSNPDALHSVRSRLKQVVVDEYQDVSVSQHKLLRLVILGAKEEEIQELRAKLSIAMPFGFRTTPRTTPRT